MKLESAWKKKNPKLEKFSRCIYPAWASERRKARTNKSGLLNAKGIC